MEITINVKYNFSAYTPGADVPTRLEGETEHSFDTDIDVNDGVEFYYAIQKEIAELSNEYLDFNFASRGGAKNFSYTDRNDKRVNGWIDKNRDRANSKTAEIICKTWIGNDYLFNADLISDKTYTLETKDYTVIKITDSLKETA